jgi:hypothetical protein
MDEQTKTELKELASSKLLSIRTADQVNFVNDPYYEMTHLPLALIDLKDIPKELKKAFDVILEVDLTIAQSRVALMIASGFSYDYISEILKITPSTTQNHRSAILTKIQKLHVEPENNSRFDTRVLLTLLVNRLLNQIK